MTAAGLAGLSLVVLGLTGSIAFEIAAWQAQPVGPSAGPVRPLNAESDSRPKPPRNDVAGRVKEVLARPLFSPDRRPKGLGTKSVAGLSRLTGVVVTGSRKIAIFAAAPGEHPVVVEEGSRINAFEVKGISDAGVTVVGPAGTMLITPSFDAAPPASKQAVPLPRTRKD